MPSGVRMARPTQPCLLRRAHRLSRPTPELWPERGQSQ